MSSIFRKSALEKLSSPEQLDRTIAVTPPASWLIIIGAAIIIAAFIIWSFTGSLIETVEFKGIIVNGHDSLTARSPIAGVLAECGVTVGETVESGGVIGVIRTRGGEEERIYSSQSGAVTTVCAAPGDAVDKYDAVAKLSPDTEDGKVIIAFLPIGSGKKIQTGMRAAVTPVLPDAKKYGRIEAEVVGVDDYVTSQADIEALIGDNSGLAGYIPVPAVSVVLALDADMSDGTLTDVRVITGESAPISKLLPVFDTEAE